MNTQNIQSVSQFRANASSAMKDMDETGSPLVLTQNGKAAAVVVSPREWEKMQESLAMLQLLVQRQQEISAGNRVDFDEGMDRMDAMIEARGAR